MSDTPGWPPHMGKTLDSTNSDWIHFQTFGLHNSSVVRREQVGIHSYFSTLCLGTYWSKITMVHVQGSDWSTLHVHVTESH